MIIEDKFSIPVPIQQVWDFFLDIPKVSQCIPGVEKVEQVDDQTFTGSLGVRVGPIVANFEGNVVLVELEPPRRLVIRAEGKDRSTASRVSGTMTASLGETAPGQTEVTYQIDVAIRGRLGQFGQAVIIETAKQISQAYATCVQVQLADRAALSLDRVQDEQQSSEELPPFATREAQPPGPPSVLSIVLSAIATSLVSGLRVLGAGVVSRLRASGPNTSKRPTE